MIWIAMSGGAGQTVSLKGSEEDKALV
jgi:hypothetical protein